MKSRFVSFHYTVKDNEGKVLDSTHDGEPMMFLEGASQIMPVLEAGIRPLKTGDKSAILISSCDAYGDRDEQLVIQVPLSSLPQKGRIVQGQQFRLEKKKQEPRVYRVIEANETHARLDGNHPLAGKDLTFEVEVVETRFATQTEPPLKVAAKSKGGFN